MNLPQRRCQPDIPAPGSAHGKVTKQILAKAIRNVKWKFPGERVPLHPRNSGWQLVTGTIWLPYVSRAERRNAYPCSFHHYNNMSKEPPLSREAHRNTTKKKNKGKKRIKQPQPRSSWHQPWKTHSPQRAAQRAGSALPMALPLLLLAPRTTRAGPHSQHLTDSTSEHLCLALFYKADKFFTKKNIFSLMSHCHSGLAWIRELV